jgi:hypothetical protein
MFLPVPSSSYVSSEMKKWACETTVTPKRLPECLCVRVSVPYKLWNQLVYYYKIHLGGYATEGDMDASFNRSKMADVQM